MCCPLLLILIWWHAGANHLNRLKVPSASCLWWCAKSSLVLVERRWGWVRSNTKKNSQREQEEGNKKNKANIKAKGKGKQKGWQKGLQRIATRKQKESSVRWDLKMGSSFRACFEQNLLPTRSGILDRGPDKREQHQPRATV